MASKDENMMDQVKQLLVEQLQIEPAEVTADLEFGGIPQWDSLGHMMVMAGLEEKFGVELDADLIAGLTSVPLIVSYLEGKRNG